MINPACVHFYVPGGHFSRVLSEKNLPGAPPPCGLCYTLGQQSYWGFFLDNNTNRSWRTVLFFLTLIPQGHYKQYNQNHSTKKEFFSSYIWYWACDTFTMGQGYLQNRRENLKWKSTEVPWTKTISLKTIIWKHTRINIPYIPKTSHSQNTQTKMMCKFSTHQADRDYTIQSISHWSAADFLIRDLIPSSW